eukprot:143123-Chlamydomonas_euryale.AAC.3
MPIAFDSTASTTSLVPGRVVWERTPHFVSGCERVRMRCKCQHNGNFTSLATSLVPVLAVGGYRMCGPPHACLPTRRDAVFELF